MEAFQIHSRRRGLASRVGSLVASACFIGLSVGADVVGASDETTGGVESSAVSSAVAESDAVDSQAPAAGDSVTGVTTQPSVDLGPAGDPPDDFDPLFDEWDEEWSDTPSGFPDPFESFNRGVLRFNNVADRFVLDPVTQAYRFILPEVARRSIIRVFDNANTPQIFVNDILQLEWLDAGSAVSRMVINSTLGIGGLMDPAKRMGLEPHLADFGQTLALAGAPSGTYLMLPLLGPTNIRDGIGLGVDAFLHPTFYLLGGTDLLLFGGSAGLTARARHFEELQALRESSVDVYAAMRSGFYQNRLGEIWSRREDRRPESEAP